MDEQLNNDWHGLLFGARRSVRYHLRRQAFFERMHNVVGVCGVFFGSAAAVAVFGQAAPMVVALLAMGVSALFAFDVVIGFSRRACLHAAIVAKFTDLEIGMTLADPSAEALARFRQQRLEIEKNEPPVLNVLNIISHNDLIKAGDYQDDMYKVSWLQRLLSGFMDWGYESIESVPSVKQKAATPKN